MGKRVKKKTSRNAQKEKQKIPTIGAVVKEARVCPHLETGINLDKVSSKITSLESLKCDDCREGVVDRRANKVKGKQGKKKGGGSSSESKSIWVCLECGQFTCGGIGFPTTPQSHATRHAKQNHHPLAIQLANPNLRWCFSCNTLIPIQTSEENGEQKDAFSSVVKVLKTRPSSENSLDVEDVWFGNGSVNGSVTEVKSVNTQISSENGGGNGYTVKGLVNLGNTCFFNSILQNLLAMDKLRDYFLKLEQPVGPLSVSLKKLFVQTNPSTIDKNIINPRSLFNSICTMAPQFKGYQQQDSHELLRFLLDGLCNEKCPPSSEKEDTFPTFIDAVFGGQICSSVSCLECGHSSIVYEPYLDLSLPLPTKKSPSKKIPPKKQNPPPKRREKVGKKININEKMSEITIKESGNGNDNSSEISSWLDYLGSEETPPPLGDDSWLDYLEPCSSSNHHDMSSQNGDTSAFQDSGNGYELFWGDEPQARVQESEILLLPYKELTSTTNGNDTTQESSDFDGFGGLFDEPEVVSGPTARNNSGSDSDEVDDSDWPVSVDKCLSHFTTSEILTKSDHAWQCEQCSKAFLKMRLKNKLQEKSVSNGVSGNGMSDSGVVNSVSNGVKNGNISDCCLGNGGSQELSHSSRVMNGEHDLNGVDDEVDSGSVKVTRDASKRILISKVPPILTIHLKRLSQDSRGRLSKLNGHVDFKETIDLEPYLDPSCCKDKGRYKYGLMGVVEHSGTARGGHYVAYVRGGLNLKSWYHASDAHVREVSFEDVLRCEAYILFYQQI